MIIVGQGLWSVVVGTLLIFLVLFMAFLSSTASADFTSMWRRYWEDPDFRFPMTKRRIRENREAFGLTRRSQFGKRVLEMCAGSGRMTPALRFGNEAVYIVTDINIHQFAPSVRFVRANAESLPFPDGSFDVVFLCACLQHIEHPDAALREARRVLVDGGVLYTGHYIRPLGLAVLKRPFIKIAQAYYVYAGYDRLKRDMYHVAFLNTSVFRHLARLFFWLPGSGYGHREVWRENIDYLLPETLQRVISEEELHRMVAVAGFRVERISWRGWPGLVRAYPETKKVSP